MSFKHKLFILLGMMILAISAVFAVTTDVSQNLADLSTQISKINQNLTQKKKLQKYVVRAINDSDVAIGKSEALLAQLKTKLDLNVQQLTQVKVLLPQIIAATNLAKSYSESATLQIYQQVNLLKAESDSLFLGNEQLQNQRKKIYLTSLLKVELQRYQSLQAKLSELNLLNAKLEDEVLRLNKQLSNAQQMRAQQLVKKEQNLNKGQDLSQQIRGAQQQLSTLKQKQAQLNQLLVQITQKQASAQAQIRVTSASQPNASATQKSSSSINGDLAYTDNEGFWQRKLAKPLTAPITVSFGVVRNGTSSNGILFAPADDLNVYAVSEGKVMYTGALAGLGQVVVVDNGDGYMSVYGGVVSQVKKAQQVQAGAVIANSGSSVNQPMGGVYFELRHLGQVVDPMKLVQ